MLSKRMFALTFYFLFVLLLCAIQAEEITAENTTKTSKLNTNDTGNSTEPTNQRKIELIDGLLDTKNTPLKEFKPSPQFENIYEFNKIPVKPAIGEAKQQQPQANARTFFWPMIDTSKQPVTTTEATWVRRVIFPHTTAETTRDQPYPFITSNNPGTTHFGAFETRPPPRIPPTLNSYGSSGFDNPRGYGYSASKWDHFRNSGSRTHYESYGLPEASPSSGLSKISQIKKVIGLLAAFIPLGLLISALTPSVIQVVPMNTT